jgi:hypothetical protein
MLLLLQSISLFQSPKKAQGEETPKAFENLLGLWNLPQNLRQTQREELLQAHCDGEEQQPTFCVPEEEGKSLPPNATRAWVDSRNDFQLPRSNIWSHENQLASYL